VAERAVLIFDFDGTIADTETPLFVAWSELYEQHGVALDLARWQSIIGTDDDFDPWDELCAAVGRPLDRSLNRLRQQRRDALMHEAGLRPGIERWLDDAERLGVPVGIASSSPPDWVDHHLARLGLRSRFSCLACADGVIPGKPDPTSYRHAVASLGGDPSLSVAVEDSPNGVRAAVAAGLYTIAVPHDLTRALDLSMAHEVVDSLEEVSLADKVVRLRRVRDDEHDLPFDLHRAAFRPFVERTYGRWDEELQRVLWSARDPRNVVEVVCIGDRPIGAVHTRAEGDAIEIDLLDIHPDHQGAGAGAAVLRQVIARGRDVSLRTHKTNPAIRLYERLGFERAGDTETHHLLRREARRD